MAWRGLASKAWVVVAAALCATGCSDDSGSGDSAAGSSTGGGDSGTTLFAPMTDDDGGTTATMEETDDGIDVSDDGPSFGNCLVWGDDCESDTQKCMPWSLLPDRIPDELRCCPIADNPKLENEACTVDEYDGSCRDDCEKGTMCIVDDLDTLSGVCRRFCDPAGSALCDPDDTCKPFFELVEAAPEVPLCMDKCDPLVQDCVQPGWLCLPDSPTVAGQSGFICTPPGPGTLNGPLTACGLANDCQEGLGCIVADRLPECDFTTCCSAFCSLSEGDSPCQDIHPELACIDWMSPDPDWLDVGICALAE
ncbi:MAG: hypothetical protein AAF721_22935 [Myxococcota bacterium]